MKYGRRGKEQDLHDRTEMRSFSLWIMEIMPKLLHSSSCDPHSGSTRQQQFYRFIHLEMTVRLSLISVSCIEKQ